MCIYFCMNIYICVCTCISYDIYTCVFKDYFFFSFCVEEKFPWNFYYYKYYIKYFFRLDFLGSHHPSPSLFLSLIFGGNLLLLPCLYFFFFLWWFSDINITFIQLTVDFINLTTPSSLLSLLFLSFISSFLSFTVPSCSCHCR